jgi:quinol monooxygenase YgiN
MTAQPGQGDALTKLLLEAAEVLGDNADCELYVISRSAADPDAVLVTEVWTSEGAHDASLGDERVRAVIERAKPLIAGMVEPIVMRPVGGKGLS